MFALTLPLVMMQVYDRILFNESLNTLVWLVVAGLLAIFIESFVKYIRDCITALLAARYEYKTECDVVRTMLGSRLEHFERQTKDDHLETLQGIRKLCKFYSGQFYQVVFDFPFAFIFLLAIYYLGGVLVLYTMTLGAVYIISLLMLRKSFKILTDQQQDKFNLKYRFIAQLLDGIPTIKSMCMEEQFLRRYESQQLNHAKAVLDQGRLRNLPTHLGALFSQMAMYGTILFGGSLVIDGSMTIGALTACMMLSTRAFQPIQSISSFVYNYATAKMYHERMDRVLNMPGEIKAGAEDFPKEIQGDIKLENLSFRWNESDDLLIDNVNLEIPRNSLVGITGAPMSGSTSLLYLMMGKLTPEKGRVLVGGKNIHDLCHNHSSGKIDFLNADTALFTGTIIENITLFNPGLYTVAKHTANMIGLDQMVAPLPMGYETEVSPKMRQYLPSALLHCICLARILVIRPRVLFVDKVTLNMDRETEKLFLEVFELLNRNCTIVCATSWPVLLKKCDRVYSLEKGKLEPVKMDSQGAGAI
jgi:ATP-binding cassette subfamily C protein LapB